MKLSDTRCKLMWRSFTWPFGAEVLYSRAFIVVYKSPRRRWSCESYVWKSQAQSCFYFFDPHALFCSYLEIYEEFQGHFSINFISELPTHLMKVVSCNLELFAESYGPRDELQ